MADYRPLSDEDVKRISGRIDKARMLLGVETIKNDPAEAMWLERYEEEAVLLLEHRDRIVELEKAQEKLHERQDILDRKLAEYQDRMAGVEVGT